MDACTLGGIAVPAKKLATSSTEKFVCGIKGLTCSPESPGFVAEVSAGVSVGFPTGFPDGCTVTPAGGSNGVFLPRSSAIPSKKRLLSPTLSFRSKMSDEDSRSSKFSSLISFLTIFVIPGSLTCRSNSHRRVSKSSSFKINFGKC